MITINVYYYTINRFEINEELLSIIVFSKLDGILDYTNASKQKEHMVLIKHIGFHF